MFINVHDSRLEISAGVPFYSPIEKGENFRAIFYVKKVDDILKGSLKPIQLPLFFCFVFRQCDVKIM